MKMEFNSQRRKNIFVLDQQHDSYDVTSKQAIRGRPGSRSKPNLALSSMSRDYLTHMISSFLKTLWKNLGQTSTHR